MHLFLFHTTETFLQCRETNSRCGKALLAFLSNRKIWHSWHTHHFAYIHHDFYHIFLSTLPLFSQVRSYFRFRICYQTTGQKIYQIAVFKSYQIITHHNIIGVGGQLLQLQPKPLFLRAIKPMLSLFITSLNQLENRWSDRAYQLISTWWESAMLTDLL